MAIKVDREERPDLDELYMGGRPGDDRRGGWPMSVFLTPDGRPFYGGTYFPDQPRHGMPSFRQVLEGVGARLARAARRARSARAAAGRDARRAAAAASRRGRRRPTAALFDDAGRASSGRFDRVNGGWGGAPKFPQPMTVDYLLRRMAGGDARARARSPASTLEKMADGGIHDQLGGGFHRYATDAHWLVPHFEQMLYDNAQLARVYLHAWARDR